MRHLINRTSWVKKGLAVSVLGLMLSSAHAASDQEQIAQLRQEVEALKALIQQQQQKVQLVESKVENTTSASAPKGGSLLSKAGASVNLYGFVRADAEYQFKGGDGIFNRINNVDLSNAPKNDDRFYGTAKATRLGLDFKAPVQGADVGGKIEIDFNNGTSESVRIRHAYLNYNNWLIGQTTSTFLSTETQPEMIDFGSPLGIGTKRTPQVRYADKIDGNTQYAVALEKGADDNRFPAATAKLSHKLGNGIVNARVLAQEVRSRATDNATGFGWGVGLGAKFDIADQLTLFGDYSHVKGDNFYILYTDNPYKATSADDIDLTDFDAVTVGVTYKISPKLRSTLGYGAIFYDDKTLHGLKSSDGKLVDSNEKLQQGWLNIMYNPVKPITFGTEYVYGERETVSGAKGRDSRLGVMAKYDF